MKKLVSSSKAVISTESVSFEMSIKYLQISLLLLLSWDVTCKNEALPKFNCDKNFGKSSCTLVNVRFKLFEDRFVPIASEPASVVALWFLRSTVPVLNVQDSCEEFPKLERIQAHRQSIEKIAENCFRGCKNLKHLILHENKIRQFTPGIFLDTPNLEFLSLAGNQLAYVPAELFKVTRKLKKFSVYSNPLLDLNADQIVKHSNGTLNEIWLQDTNIECARMKKILITFESKKIEISKFSYRQFLRPRNYTVAFVEGFMCLPEEEYEKATADYKIHLAVMQAEAAIAIASSIDDAPANRTAEDEIEDLHIKIRDLEQKNHDLTNALINTLDTLNIVEQKTDQKLFHFEQILDNKLKNIEWTIQSTRKRTLLNMRSILNSHAGTRMNQLEHKLNYLLGVVGVPKPDVTGNDTKRN